MKINSIFIFAIIAIVFFSLNSHHLASAGKKKVCNKTKMYAFNEFASKYGPHRCNDDCDCDRLRRCSPYNWCANCMDLVEIYPFKYNATLCNPKKKI